MGILLSNALLVDIDPLQVEQGMLRLSGGRIAGRGPSLAAEPGDERIDCGGAIVLPGFVNGHTHLYSALAVGLPPPPRAPRNFLEVLQLIWWRLDQAHDAESIELSAAIGAAAALRHGATTLIDHHASPNCIAGSLDRVERGLARVGVRGVLCYETTDRHGRDGRAAGLAENRRYLDRCRRDGGGRFAGLVGAHASFTLDDESLDSLAALARESGTGVHIHVAEDPCDGDDARQRRGAGLIERLTRHGIVRAGSVFAHATHLSTDEIAAVHSAGVTIAHNPRSNMHNAVGHAPVAAMAGAAMLGTDGIGADMLAEARAAWFISRHQHAGISPMDVVAMLAAAARRASTSLGVTLGRLLPGAAADVVITDYLPHTPLTADNLVGHLICGIDGGHVRDVIVDGQWRLRNRRLLGVDEVELKGTARRVTEALWRRMAAIPA